MNRIEEMLIMLDPTKIKQSLLAKATGNGASKEVKEFHKEIHNYEFLRDICCDLIEELDSENKPKVVKNLIKMYDHYDRLSTIYSSWKRDKIDKLRASYTNIKSYSSEE